MFCKKIVHFSPVLCTFEVTESTCNQAAVAVLRTKGADGENEVL